MSKRAKFRVGQVVAIKKQEFELTPTYFRIEGIEPISNTYQNDFQKRHGYSGYRDEQVRAVTKREIGPRSDPQAPGGGK